MQLKVQYNVLRVTTVTTRVQDEKFTLRSGITIYSLNSEKYYSKGNGGGYGGSCQGGTLGGLCGVGLGSGGITFWLRKKIKENSINTHLLE